jgi:hypothetical protein
MTQANSYIPIINPDTGDTVKLPVTISAAGVLTIAGNIIGNMTGLLAAVAPTVVSASSGALAIPTIGNGSFSLTYAGAGGYTLVRPAAVDDGKILTIVTEVAQAHVITCSTDGFNAKGSSGTATWTAAIGNYLVLMARNTHWFNVGILGVALA